MKRVPYAGLWLVLVGALAASTAARAAWQFTPAADPERRWSASLATGIGFDDNVNTSPNDKQSSMTGTIEPSLLVSLPMERTSLGLRYTYNSTYYEKRAGDKFNQSHVLDTSVAWSVNPRFNLSIGDNLVYGLEPGLVENQGGVSIVERQRGDYLYNNLSGRMAYNLSRRWTASLAGGWQTWNYADSAVATTNNHNSYYTLLGVNYALNPRTFVGGNYRYSTDDYESPGTNSSRNSQSHQVYISVVRQLNPQLSGSLNGGMELREFGDGTQQTAPSFSGSMTYNYGLGSSVVGTFSYFLSTTEVGSYRSTDVASGLLQINHRLTTRLNGSASASYSHSTYQNPTPVPFPFTPPPDGLTEDAIAVHLNLTYTLLRWLEGSTTYSYDDVSSQVAGRSFSRNQIWLGLRVLY